MFSPQVPVFVREYQRDTFDHWKRKQALASDDELVKCMDQAKECIEQMRADLSFSDEPFPRVYLEALPYDDITR